MFNFIKKYFFWITLLISVPFLVDLGKHLFHNYPEIRFIFETLDNFKAYFAAIFSLIFATYTFYNQRNETIDKELKEKEKDRESKKDYYRPIFVVREDVNSNNFEITLLMKENHLCLEDVMIQTYKSQPYLVGDTISHNTIFENRINSSIFFITGKTLIGETIIFGYINKIKIYKYLKSKEIEDLCKSDITKEEFCKICGSFNTTEDSTSDKIIKFFISSTKELRKAISESEAVKTKELLNTESIKKGLESFLNEVRNTVKNKKDSKDLKKNITSELKKIITLYKENLNNLAMVNNKNKKRLLYVLYYYTKSPKELANLCSKAIYEHDVNKNYPKVIEITLEIAEKLLDNYNIDILDHYYVIDFFEEIIELIYFTKNKDNILLNVNAINIQRYKNKHNHIMIQ